MGKPPDPNLWDLKQADAALDPPHYLLADKVGERAILSSHEHEAAEETIRRLNTDLSATLQAIPDLLFEVDRKGTYLNVWARNTSLLARQKELTLGHTIADVLAPEAARIAMASLAEADEKGASYGMVYGLDLPNGTRWFELSVSKKDNRNEPDARFIVLSRDITERRLAEEAVKEQELKYRLLFETANDGIFLQDETGFIDCNQRGASLYGCSKEDLIGRSPADFAPERQPDGRLSAEVAVEKIQAALQGEPQLFEWRPMRADGTPFDVEITLTRMEIGASVCLQAIVRDITERKRIDTNLQLAANVFTQAREAIAITDPAGTIMEVNDAFTRITGYGREEALGQNPRILKSGRQDAEYYASMWQALNDSGHWAGEIWNRRKNGEVYAEMLTIGAVRDAAGKTQNYVAMFTDITPMKEHQKQLEHIAHYDALTGLPNRVLLADRLQQAIIQSQRRNQSLAVVYLDLDGFKAVNDHYGHDVGDELLIVVAQHMKEALREGDTLARIGGDEFVVVLVDLEQPQDCEPVLSRLLRAAAAPVAVGETLLKVSASIGVTLYPQDGADADKLLRHADQAMYQAKQAGKNRYHLFDVDQDAAVKTQRESLEHVRYALDRREFVLHYQPKVNMKTGAVIGVEALIRWQHPERGLLLPAAFLPIIEDHPISVELGEWVIAAALTQMSEWHAAGLDILVSVNIGARQLQQNDFMPRLATLLAAHPEVQPACLELEVLETSALEDMLHVSSVMHACREIGVSFALDDFGTGYSSLTYLKRLPAELLKIDQSFVRGMLEDPEDLAIVEGVVGLAASFRRNVIAEGVETVAHGELLLPLGCELAQGYGIARPMPGADLPAWVLTWRPDAAWTAWSGRSLSRDDLVAVYAEVEHLHWLRAIESYLAGDRDDIPSLDAHNCHLGRWQEAEGRTRYGEHPEFTVVGAAHERLHALGQELVELGIRGRKADAQARQGELRGLRDELNARLRGLVRSG